MMLQGITSDRVLPHDSNGQWRVLIKEDTHRCNNDQPSIQGIHSASFAYAISSFGGGL